MAHTATHNEKTYDVYKLIEEAAALPIELEATMQLEICQVFPGRHCWKVGQIWLGPWDIINLHRECGGDWNVMMQTRPEWRSHILRVKNAEYDRFPLLLVDECMVIDGMHRLARAIIDGAPTMQVRRFSALPAVAEVVNYQF